MRATSVLGHRCMSLELIRTCWRVDSLAHLFSDCSCQRSQCLSQTLYDPQPDMLLADMTNAYQICHCNGLCRYSSRRPSGLSSARNLIELCLNPYMRASLSTCMNAYSNVCMMPDYLAEHLFSSMLESVPPGSEHVQSFCRSGYHMLFSDVYATKIVVCLFCKGIKRSCSGVAPCSRKSL